MKNYIYGKHPVQELLAGSPTEVIRLFVSSAGQSDRFAGLIKRAERNNIAVVTVSKRRLSDLVGDVNHQGIVALAKPFEYANIKDMLAAAESTGVSPLLVALDEVTDPHNIGAITRSAYALGAHGLILCERRSGSVTPTVVKSSAGATAHLPIARVKNLRQCLDTLKDMGLWAIGTMPGESGTIADVDWSSPSVMVIGSEGKGLRPLTAKTCDTLAAIPMVGELGSLNASVSAAICLYEAARQRG